jgi:hypothetical protein
VAEGLFNTVASKIAGGAAALVVVIGGITFFFMAPETRSAILGGTGKILAWLGIVLLVPWATFFIIGRVARMESNAAGAALVLGYTVMEFLMLLWLFDWSVSGAAAWTFATLGCLLAVTYNVFTCDWIAEKVA